MEHGDLLLEECNFLDVAGKRWIAGSLYQLFDIIIVVGTGHWIDATEEPLPEDDHAVKADMFFYQKGVIVFPLQLAGFNEAANKYLNTKINSEAKQIITFGSH